VIAVDELNGLEVSGGRSPWVGGVGAGVLGGALTETIEDTIGDMLTISLTDSIFLAITVGTASGGATEATGEIAGRAEGVRTSDRMSLPATTLVPRRAPWFGRSPTGRLRHAGGRLRHNVAGERGRARHPQFTVR
jgi:hypothetical protein